MRERLLGYLLGALDAEEHAEVERMLASNPELQRELDGLRAMLVPLEEAREQYEPPGDLVTRTCDRIAQFVPGPGLNVGIEGPAGRHGGSWADVVVALGVCLALAVLFFPAIATSRELARRIRCQDNLRHVALALQAYADAFGTAPYIPAHGNLSIAGMVPIQMMESDLIEYSQVLCPGTGFDLYEARENPPVVRVAGQAYAPNVPSWRKRRVSREELASASGGVLHYLQRIAAGDYAFNLGVRDGQRYGPARYEARHSFAMAADAPSPHLAGRVTNNHGARGFNVLFEDGHIVFLRSCCVPGTEDDFFRSADGFIESGKFKDDSVLGGSHARPLP